MSSLSTKESFLTIIQENKKLIFKVCNSYAQDPDDRKDLVQEVILQLWRSFGSYHGGYKLSTWMYRVALNTAISWYRTERKHKDNTFSIDNTLIDILDENDRPVIDEQVKLLYEFINQFNELNKALMILYLDNSSYKEIADILGISQTNVATKISRIKQQLKLKFAKI